MTESTTNLLYYSDNLDILRRYVKNETVDLVYLDPPFLIRWLIVGSNDEQSSLHLLSRKLRLRSPYVF